MYDNPQIITDEVSKKTMNVAPLFKLLHERFDGNPDYAAKSLESTIRFFILHIDLTAIEKEESRNFINSFDLLFLLKDSLRVQ
jgi:hypothetical protein